MLLPFKSILTTGLALLLLLSVAVCYGQDRDKMVKTFEGYFQKELKSPAEYREKVNVVSKVFPDGNVLPYSLLAVGLCQRIYEKPGPLTKPRLPAVESAIELLLAANPEKDLTKKHGMVYSHQAMALAAYRLAGGKRKDWEDYEAKLYPLLVELLEAKKGLPIDSFPDRVRPLDTTVALFALTLRDRVAGTQVAPPLVKAHLEWLNGDGADFETGLPCSEFFPDKKRATGARGCDLSWRLALWTEIDKKMADQWYRMYRIAFWHDDKFLKGFCEWGGDREVKSDVESGPIINGVGCTATVLGPCVTRAFKDDQYDKIIIEQAAKLAKARKSRNPVSKVLTATVDKRLNEVGIPTDGQYITGSLYGDVMAFHALSWHPFPKN